MPIYEKSLVARFSSDRPSDVLRTVMEGYPSLVKGTVLKTVRSFATRGFEPHTFLLINNLFYLFHPNVKQSCSLNTCGLK